MEIQKLAERLDLEIEDFKELFEIYMEATSSDLEVLKAGLKAGDLKRVHEIAHSIKGSSGNLGFNELYELARDIDDRARENSLNGLEDLVSNFTVKYEKLVEDFEKSSEA